MNWTTVAGTAAGITGIFGVLGLIIYAILRMAEPRKLLLTPELITALMDHGIAESEAARLTPKRLAMLLKAKEEIASDLIDKVLQLEVSQKGRTVLLSSAGLVVAAVVLGTVALVVGKSQANVGQADTCKLPDMGRYKCFVGEDALDNCRVARDESGRLTLSFKFGHKDTRIDDRFSGQLTCRKAQARATIVNTYRDETDGPTGNTITKRSVLMLTQKKDGEWEGTWTSKKRERPFSMLRQ